MVDFANWFLLFVRQTIAMLFNLTSIDGYSMGSMLLAVSILGLVISATIGAVALVSSTIRTNSYIGTTRARQRAIAERQERRIDAIERNM